MQISFEAILYKSFVSLLGYTLVHYKSMINNNGRMSEYSISILRVLLKFFDFAVFAICVFNKILLL